MKRATIVLLLILMPTILLAQGAVRVSSAYGKVEWKPVTGRSFITMPVSTQNMQVGDQVRTGPGSTVTLELADGSYMVVSENSNIQIQAFWAGDLKSLVNVALGKVRFYIQKLGGRPNPYSVGTPSALIAVRGTIFDVSVDEGQYTEVECLEGRVAVEGIGLPGREVILEPGRKTGVHLGEYPMTPIAAADVLERKLLLKVVKKSPAEEKSAKDAPSTDVVVRDNDKRNRPSGLDIPPSQTNPDVQRSKPTLSYPNQ